MSRKKRKIIVVFGTRPEAIKMAPLVARLKRNRNFILRTVVTAQHRKMLDQVLNLFDVKPEYDLNIMMESQTLHRVASKCILGLKKIFDSEKPDLVLVHGDTTTTLASALCSYYTGIPVGHVEAGLRSFDVNNPFPEEQNRRLSDALSLYHFAPTTGNRENLLKESISRENIFVTGNTVIDALMEMVKKNLSPENKKLKSLDLSKKIVLITAHRRENFGQPLRNICSGLRKLSSKFKQTQFVYPVHPNPNVKDTVRDILSNIDNIILLPPVSYIDMVWLLKNCYLCFTDSGGIQEEAPALGKPVLVLRKVTERPEAVECGTVRVIGAIASEIYKWGEKLLTDEKTYKMFSRSVNPYGDGKAAMRIVDALEYKFGFRKERPRQWKI